MAFSLEFDGPYSLRQGAVSLSVYRVSHAQRAPYGWPSPGFGDQKRTGWRGRGVGVGVGVRSRSSGGAQAEPLKGHEWGGDATSAGKARVVG